MPEVKLFQGKARVLQLTCFPVEVLVILTACAPEDIEDRVNAHQAEAKLPMKELGMWMQSKNWGILVELEGLYFHHTQVEEKGNAS